MATVEKKQCDVFGTLNNVQTVRVMFDEYDYGRTEYVAIRRVEVDMSPRAIARLLKFIERGTSPPNHEKGKP